MELQTRHGESDENGCAANFKFVAFDRPQEIAKTLEHSAREVDECQEGSNRAKAKPVVSEFSATNAKVSFVARKQPIGFQPISSRCKVVVGGGGTEDSEGPTKFRTIL